MYQTKGELSTCEAVISAKEAAISAKYCHTNRA
jgi:hypothetical protein